MAARAIKALRCREREYGWLFRIPDRAQQREQGGDELTRLRGVEEKGGTEGNQTVDQPAEMDKKP